MLMADLEPVIADLPTVPSDKVETIEDQLPEVPTTEPKSKTRTPVAVAAS